MFFILRGGASVRWIYKIFIFVAVFLILYSLVVGAYSEQDLWILEVVINQSLSNSQTMDALIIEDKAFLPVVALANMLEININVDNDKGILKFNRPGDGSEVNINLKNEKIRVNGNLIDTYDKMVEVNGKLFLNQECLSQLMDADFEYDPTHLVVSVKTDHIKRVITEHFNKNAFGKEEKKKEVKDKKKFTISNINYNWSGSWEKKQKAIIKEENDSKKGKQEVDEDWGTSLDLTAKGILYDWRYQLGISNELGNDNSFSTTLDTVLFIYDMDKARFKVGKMGVQTEEELQLDNNDYSGLSYISHTSPLMGSNGNLIQVEGDAPIGSTVTLYVNDWKTDTQKVGFEKKYLFKDILIYQRLRANDLKVKIEKSNGQVEIKHRYVTASNVILNKDKFNYLVQVGELNSEKASDNYFLNTIGYWGASDKTTLGFGWYREFFDNGSLPELTSVFDYSSLRLNHRLGDKYLLKTVLYQNKSMKKSEDDSDIGYKVNLDYRNDILRSGVEYHRQAEQLNYMEDERLKPNNVLKLYYLQDITSNSIVEGKYTRYRERENSDHEEEIYYAGYKIKRDKWKAALNYEKDINNENEEIYTDTWNGTLSYLITPNIELINELGYEARLNDFLNEKVNIGVQGLIKSDSNSYLMRVDWKRELDEYDTDIEYQLSWQRKWSLSKESNIQTKIGYKYENKDKSHIIPLNASYSKELTNDRELSLNYQGVWEKDINSEDIDHRVFFSYSGAFNFFGGKIESTSPWAFASRKGMVSGFVFRDSNRNGMFDKGEELLSDITVKLGRKKSVTNKEGIFKFKEVNVGDYRLSFDYNQLPIILTPSIQNKSIQVKSNEKVTENLGLYTVGTVDGNVQVSNVKTHKLSLSGIKVTAEPGGYSAMTNYDGYYFFDQLPVGDYTISIEKSTLPDWILNKKAESYKIKISEKGEYISGKNFNIEVKPEKIADNQVKKEKDVKKINVVNEDKRSNTLDKKEEIVDITEQVMKINLNNDKVTYKGQEYNFEILFIKKYDKIWAPIRRLAELFGSKVFWDNQLNKIYIVDENLRILFDVELGLVNVNGELTQLKDRLLMESDHYFLSLEDLGVLKLKVHKNNNQIYIYEK